MWKVKKTFEVEIPKGYEIDKEHSTFERIIFKKIKNELPKSWGEIKNFKGYYINDNSMLVKVENDIPLHGSRKLFPTLELAEASLALAQLLQLRERYNDGWKPNWGKNTEKYCIRVYSNKLEMEICFSGKILFAFKTNELCETFFKNFQDLLIVAKPLM